MDYFSPRTVRHAAALTIAISFMYTIFRRAKMYQVYRGQRGGGPSQGPELDALGDCGQPRALCVERSSNLPNWDRWLAFYYAFSLAFNSIEMLKYLLVCLLDLNWLGREHFGYLDCLLIGRTAVNPRIVGLLKYASFCVFCFHCLQHAILFNGRTLMHVPSMEFLLMSPEEVKYREARSNGGDDDDYCTLMSYRHPFRRQPTYPVRPNRTLAAWRQLGTLATGWLLAIAGGYLVLLPIDWAIFVPMVVTRPGFEATYHVCVKWLAQREPHSAWRRAILDVPANYTGLEPRVRRRLFMSAFEPWLLRETPTSGYHAVRVLYDLFANFVFQTQLVVALLIYMIHSITSCLDVCLYCHAVDAQMRQIISRHHQRQLLIVHSPHEGRVVRRGSYEEADQRDNERHIADVQAQLVDLFDLIRVYNAYQVYFVCFCVFIWYTYSLICSSWLFIPTGGAHNESSSLESYLIQSIITLIFLILMAFYSRTSTACARLYRSVATATSLQQVDTLSRVRWMVIMKHYQPVPLYCFSLFTTSELSGMFALKLLAWLFSALLILSSFSVSFA